MKNFLMLLILSCIFRICLAQSSQIVRHNFNSASLNGKQVTLDVYLPSNYSSTNDPYRLLIFLHGAGQNTFNSNWPIMKPVLDNLINNGIIDPIIVVYPGLTGTVPGKEPLFWGQHVYRNSIRNGDFSDALTIDLMDWLYNVSGINVSDQRESRALGGFSDGGSGCIYNAITHSDQFIAFASHGGGPALAIFETWLPQLLSQTPQDSSNGHYLFGPNNGTTSILFFGEGSAFSPNMSNPPHYVDFPVDTLGLMIPTIFDSIWMKYHDAATLIDDTTVYTHPLAMYFDTRSGDLGYSSNILFSQQLTARNIPHTFNTYSGGHYLGADAVENALLWLDNVMDSTITNIEYSKNSTVPQKYFLSQNYPNPFNPKTIIKFTLPKSEKVRIEIFNSLGQKVMTLLNKEISPGAHILEFNARDIQSGIYYYVIKAGAFTDVKKMILIK